MTTPAELVPEAPYELVERMRASVVVLGPCSARCGRARVSMPGGDDFGPRPIDMHLRALEPMGASFDLGARLRRRAVESSVAASPAWSATASSSSTRATPAPTTCSWPPCWPRARTVIENAAREPEVRDLADFLNAMGAHIEGAGTSRIEVEGVDAPPPGLPSR